MDALLRDQWITTESEFIALASSWNKLVSKGNYSVFYRHEWFLAAWKWQTPDTRLCIYCLFKKDSLIGIIPLVCLPHHDQGIHFQQLQFLTVPDTQFCDAITNPHEQQLVLLQFFKALQKTPMLWDKLRLDYLGQSSPFYQYRSNILKHTSFLIHCNLSNQHDYIDCSGNFDDYTQQRSKKLIKANRNIQNKWKDQTDWEIQYHDHLSPEKLENLLLHWKILVNHSWKKETATTLLHSQPHAFLTALSTSAVKNHWFSLYVLSIKNTWIACEYQLQDKQQRFALRSDYRTDYQHLAPGCFLQQAVLQHCFNAALCHTYYLGPGLNPYKQRWSTHRLPVMRCTAYRSSWRGKILSLLDKQRVLRQEWSPTGLELEETWHS